MLKYTYFCLQKESKPIKLFIFYYRPGPIITQDIYQVPILVGHQNKDSVSGFISDDTGENISEKNNFYSELTGLYWIWKNQSSDIIGSTHYRRYFSGIPEPFLYRLKRLAYYPIGLFKKRYGLIYTRNVSFWKDKILSQEQIKGLLKEYDGIMPTRRKFKYSIEEHYRRYHNIKDLDTIKSILLKDYPEYIFSFDKVLKGNRLFANNMFILKEERFQELMTWLFDILFKLEKEFDLSKYTGYQERIFGFLSERLITLWIEHNQINYKELDLIYFKKFKKV